MKKTILSVLIAATLISSAGCGTIFGGTITDCQRKPKSGPDNREIRWGAWAADWLVFPIGHIVDWCTLAIYKPCKK
jgi:hypothetical protein